MLFTRGTSARVPALPVAPAAKQNGTHQHCDVWFVLVRSHYRVLLARWRAARATRRFAQPSSRRTAPRAHCAHSRAPRSSPQISRRTAAATNSSLPLVHRLIAVRLPPRAPFGARGVSLRQQRNSLTAALLHYSRIMPYHHSPSPSHSAMVAQQTTRCMARCSGGISSMLFSVSLGAVARAVSPPPLSLSMYLCAHVYL